VSGTGPESTQVSSNEVTVDFSTTVYIDGPIVVSFQGPLPYFSEPEIAHIAPLLKFSGDIPDDRAAWHHNYTPINSWMSAHIYREVNGWSIKETADRLAAERDLPQMLGFFEEGPVKGDPGDPPSYTQLRDMWEEEFTPRHRGAVKVIANRLVQYCRNNGIPAPEEVFQPEEDVEVDDAHEDDQTVRELTINKTADVWEHIRPLVLKHWYLKRHHNWQIPESQFFDAHAALGADSDDVCAESGLGNYEAKGVIDDAHYPSTHRRELSKFSVEEIRDLHRSVVKDIIAEARRKGELVGKMTLAIDGTKGHPWTGEIERDEDGNNIEPWRLGYKNDNDTRAQYYYQWAAIQVVGFDIPIVLDALPVRRGMTKGEIVDDLVSSAKELLDDVEVVLMDADFDSEASKNSAEGNDALYINRKSRDKDDKRRMRQMWSDVDDEREAIRIVEQEDRHDMPNRKIVYVPKTMVDTGDEDENESDGMRQELIEDFTETVLEDNQSDRPDSSPFDSVVGEMREEEQAKKDNKDEDFDASELYLAFETNHPLAAKRPGRDKDEFSDLEHKQAAARIVRKYGSRWGIENGFKKRGHFLPRTASPNHVLRFFGFIFSATLYNAWRIVDLLVKLTVEDDPEYTPLVTASRFMAVMEGQFGLSKPPPTA
jgi:IS4 transposase